MRRKSQQKECNGEEKKRRDEKSTHVTALLCNVCKNHKSKEAFAERYHHWGPERRQCFECSAAAVKRNDAANTRAHEEATRVEMQCQRWAKCGGTDTHFEPDKQKRKLWSKGERVWMCEECKGRGYTLRKTEDYVCTECREVAGYGAFSARDIEKCVGGKGKLWCLACKKTVEERNRKRRR